MALSTVQNQKKSLLVRDFLIKITFSGFTSFKCTFKGPKLQIYGDKFQNIQYILRVLKDFGALSQCSHWVILNDWGSFKLPVSQNSHFLSIWSFFVKSQKYRLLNALSSIKKSKKFLAGARFYYRNNFYNTFLI